MLVQRGCRAIIGLCLLVAAALPAAPPMAAASEVASPTLVHVVPVEATVEFGLERFVRRAVEEAEAAGADLILFELDTPGGRVDAALKIREAITGSAVPTAAYVRHWALSAGALLALSADSLYMAPDASIGAAEPRPAEEKYVSGLRAEFEATARRNGRDPEIAAAMVDADVAIEGVVDREEILTLTGEEAMELEFIDGLTGSRAAALEALGAAGAEVHVARMRGPERVARFVTQPYVAPVLLAVGLAGLVGEALLPGLGLPGLLGGLALALYYGGHMLAGLAGWEVVMIFLVGAVLLAVEVFVPGFGVFGLGGLAAMILSVFLAAPSAEDALRSLFVALAVAMGLAVVLIRYFGARGAWKRLALASRQDPEEGFVAPNYPTELEGSAGRTLTPLRPAGAAMIDGKRWDVVTQGGFIERGRPVRVVAVQGARIVVAEAPDGDEQQTT